MAEVICSAKGCKQAADWAIRWNNPRLHSPGRRKTWTACADHRAHLENFLTARSFPVQTVGIDQIDEP